MDIINLILSAIILGGGVFYLASCLFAFSGHFRAPRTSADIIPEIPDVSVIIAARNEEDNIGLLLDDLLKQDYPAARTEIVVVDDCSEDGTADIVRGFIEKSVGKIRLASTLDSKSPYSHKKRAVHEGILSTTGEIIITLDADCRVGTNWLETMTNNLVPGIDLVAGEVIVSGGGLAGLTDTLEFTGIQMMASGFMNAGFPLTCNGANLAYRRSAFERVGGFENIGRMVSGDDDLLMQKIAEGDASRVTFITDKDSAVYTDAVGSFGEFYSRRARWASKITSYPSKSAVALLGAFFIYFIAIPLCLALAVFGLFDAVTIAAGIGLKIAGEFLLVYYGLIKIGRRRLILLFPFAEIVHIPYMIAVNLKGVFGTFEWRGRTTQAVSAECGK
jgi:cellulose synthase/poly-beta-1,6-N-acetylglucosamine synthase-like glycosyltransferase